MRPGRGHGERGVRARRIQAWIWRSTAIAALLAAAALSAPVIRDEWISARMEAAAATDLGASAPPPWEDGGVDHLCDGPCPPRADAALGVHLTVLASRDPNPGRRRAMLARAQARLGAALRVRPTAGGWWVWLAYARALDGADRGQVFQAIANSYAAAPFLAREGPWRASLCGADWPLVSVTLRKRAIAEAVWMRDIDPAGARRVFAAFDSPDAAAALKAGLARPPALLVPHRLSGSPDRVGSAG